MPDDLIFATPEDWNRWLADHHATEKEVWITYWKKGTGKPSINWQQAVVEALCWGWIDGVRKTVDAERFTQRFTPRRKGSIWSLINRNHAERLIAEGRMQPPGLAAVEEARANGQWQKAYLGGMADVVVPPDLTEALAQAPAARAFFDSLDAKNRFAIYYRLTSVKRAETRSRKIADYVAMLARGERLI